MADYEFYEISAEELGLTGIDTRNPDDMLRFGSSFFQMLQIDVDQSELAVDTYSALLDNFGATEYDDRQRYNSTEEWHRIAGPRWAAQCCFRRLCLADLPSS